MFKKRGFVTLILGLLLLAGCGDSFKRLIIAKLPDKLVYNIGESLSFEGLRVLDQSSNEVLDYSTSLDDGYIFSNSGNYTIAVSKSGYQSTSFNVLVNSGQSRNLTIYSYPVKRDYYLNEKLDLTGLSIKDEQGSDVYNYSTSILDGATLTTVGIQTVTISKLGYNSTSFNITVSEVPSTTLVIEKLPNKTSYVKNDYLSLQGMKVTCQNQVITDYTTSIPDGSKLTQTGNISIVVSKTNYISTSFTIFVSEYSPVEDNVTIDFNYINDTHGAFSRQNTDSNPYETGMSYISQFYKDNKTANSILLSGGDMFQGGWESNQTKGLIMADAMNIAGFDAMVMGNHELDWGEPALIEISKRINFPMLSCNVFYASDHTSRPEYLSPFTIIERSGVKIGIIGAAQEDLGTSITGSVSSSFYFPDPTPYVQEYSDLLRTNYNCDLVVAAFHSGGFYSYESDFYYPELLEISPNSHEKYIDGVFLAHDHLKKSGYLYSENEKVPYLEAGKNGVALGNMTFNMEKSYDEYEISDCSVSINTYLYSYATAPDPLVDNLTEVYKDQIGDPNAVIINFKYSYSKEEFARLICEAMYWYVNNNISQFGGEKVYLATHNDGGVRVNYISSGDFTYANLTTAMPFDNDLCIQSCNSYNISYMKNSSAYEYYEEEDPVYVSGLTKAVTISYICENEIYGPRCQESYIKYAITAKTVFVEFLKANQGRL